MCLDEGQQLAGGQDRRPHHRDDVGASYLAYKMRDACAVTVVG